MTMWYGTATGTVTTSSTLVPLVLSASSTTLCFDTFDGDVAIREVVFVAETPQARETRLFTEAHDKARMLALRILPKHIIQELDVNGGTWIPSLKWRDLEYNIPADRDMVSLRYKGEAVGRLCFQASETLPLWDEVLLRYMLITADEDKVWQVAKQHGVPTTFRSSLVPV